MKRLTLIALAALLPLCAEASPDCGAVSTFGHSPETQDLFPLKIDAINKKNVVDREIFPLKPGTYDLKVYEQIQIPDLMVNASRRGYSKILTITVEAGKRYELSAKFNRDKRLDPDNYWEPVIRKTDTMKSSCKPMAIEPKTA